MRTLNNICLIIIILACVVTANIALYQKAFTVYSTLICKKPNKLNEYCIVDVNSSHAIMFDAEGENPPISIFNGTNLKVLEKTKNWVKVSTESGRIGYMLTSNVEFIKN